MIPANFSLALYSLLMIPPKSDKNPWLGLLIMLVVFASIALIQLILKKIPKLSARKKALYFRVYTLVYGLLNIFLGFIKGPLQFIGILQLILGCALVGYAMFYNKLFKEEN